MRDLYLKPAGLVSGLAAKDEGPAQGSLRLAGGWLDFTLVELFARRARQGARRLLSIAEFCERDWGGATLSSAARLDALHAARLPLLGRAFVRPWIMGVVNITPDSFSDGGSFAAAKAAIDHALALDEAGADIIDLGAESTRPRSDAVPLDEELRRLLPVLEGIAGRTRALVSVDTRKSEVMRRAAAAGANMLNDVSALTHDPAALETAAELGLPVVLMHAQGDPKTMQDAPHYDHVLLDVFDYLEGRIEASVAAGIPRARLIADPGIGFGKTAAHNLELMANLALFHGLGVPILLGASRKSFIGALTGVKEPRERIAGSISAALSAVAQGAQIVRVHDVVETRQALAVWEACLIGRMPAASGSQA
jgi:dihydropteroate synthase